MGKDVCVAKSHTDIITQTLTDLQQLTWMINKDTEILYNW